MFSAEYQKKVHIGRKNMSYGQNKTKIIHKIPSSVTLKRPLMLSFAVCEK